MVIDNLKNKIVDNSIDVANKVVDLYKGYDLSFNSVLISEGVKKEIKEYESMLKNKDNEILCVEDLYKEEYLDFNTPADIDSPDDSYTTEKIEELIQQGFDMSDYFTNTEESVIIDDIVNNDEKIYKDNGKDVISIKDIKRDEDDNGIVSYNGITMYISKDKIPYSYSDIIKSKDFRFKLEDYKLKRENGLYKIDIIYKSLSDKNTLIVSISSDKESAKSIKIDLIEGE